MDDQVKKFTESAKKYWTNERLKKLTGGKKLLMTPENAPYLLRVMGLLNADASMSADKTRKFLQINHFVQLVSNQLDHLFKMKTLIRVFDMCCGNSYLSFILMWVFEQNGCEALLIGVDRNKNFIATAENRALQLGNQNHCRFMNLDLNADELSSSEQIASFFGSSWPDHPRAHGRPNLVMALHACDTASDLAMQKLISYKTDCFAIAPCCQAQLAQLWRDEVFLQQKRNHALYPMFSNPHFRRECAADITDLMRTLFARAHGYEVSVTEFTSSKHTPKNRILVGTRRGNYCADALKQLQSLTEEVGSLEVWSGYVSPQLPVQS